MSLQGNFTSDGEIRVSWDPPARPNGPINGYNFKIGPFISGDSIVKKLPGRATSYLYFPTVNDDM